MKTSTKLFRVVAVSSNTNAFGLRGIVLASRDGEMWQIGRNQGITPWVKGQDINVPCFTEEPEEINSPIPQWHMLNVEIPQKMTANPKEVIAHVFGNENPH